jgi:hydroxyacylglutathione hydrolase
MLFEQLTVGPFQCNCSILACEETQEAIIIDPGDEANRILSILEKYQLKVKYIVHTHAHLDHVGATRPVFEKTKAETCLHREDLFLYENVPMQAAIFNLQAPPTCPITNFIQDKDVLRFGNHSIEVLHTPGHTPGSVTFHLATESTPLLFTGDTLFLQSIGRTDLWGGDYNLILKSIQEKLLQFEDETIVYPGHGPKTNIGFERSENPFLSEAI